MTNTAAASLAALVEQLTLKPEELDPKALARLTEKIAAVFKVRPDEVAVLVVTQKGFFLRFIVPEKLQEIGQIPLSSASALASRTAREKKPEIINNFAAIPHASVFEAVPLREGRGEPIQKIMSAPILLDRQVGGVVQICRKGKNSVNAGADFGPQDLRELIATAGVIAPCIPILAPG